MSKLLSIVKNVDFWVAIIFILLSILIIRQIPLVRRPEARMMPAIIATLTFVSGFGLLIWSLFRSEKPVSVLLFNKKEILFFAILITAFLVVYLIGLLPGILFLIPASGFFVHNELNKKQIITMTIFSIVLFGILYVGFFVLLGMHMARGILV